MTQAAAKPRRRNPVVKGDEPSEETEPTSAPPTRTPTRTPAQYSIRDTFGVDMGFEKDDQKRPKLDAKGNPVYRDRDVGGFADRTDWVPEIDPDYVFPDDDTKMLLLALELKDRVLITGETGTGKTTLVEQVAARLNYQLVKINFDGHVTRNDLVGEWVVKGKSMTFQYGILVHAFQMPGTIILLDEWDTISGECAFVLQRPLDKNDGKILVLETGGELIPLHEDNAIVATANTIGQGDETGNYSQGTKVQNYSQLNRFGVTITRDYLSEDKEVEMLCRRFSDLDRPEGVALVRAINAVRDGYVNGQISVPLSPRDLINWTEKYLMLGEPLAAARYCFLNRMVQDDAVITEQIIQRIFED